MNLSHDEIMYRKTRWTRTLFGRWRVHSFRTHFERGYTRHWFLYGRDGSGALDRNIDDFSLSAYRVRSWELAAEVTVADGALGAEELRFYFALPFVGKLFLSFQNAAWLVRLLGQEYVIGRSKFGDCERELGFNWYGGNLSLSFWANSNQHWGGRYRFLDLKNRLLGRAKYTRTKGTEHDALLTMPEGEYPLKVTLYTATWKRPRWPWPVVIQRADIKPLNEGGIPFPGKGENSWGLDDDAVFGMTGPAATVEEAVEMLRVSVMRDRER